LPAVYILSFLTSVILAFGFTRYIRDCAIAHGWVDKPSAGRHLHTTPIPRIGGVAILLAFLCATVISFIVARLTSAGNSVSARTVLALLAPALIIFLVGLYDDLRPLKPNWKFIIQGAAGILLYFGGFGIHQFDLFSTSHPVSIFVGLLLTIFWVVLITNAFNLIDGLDGLAAGSALFSTIIIFVVSLVRHNSVVSLLSIILAGSILGFLRFNFNPATIFLGDSGSLFIGFMLAALGLSHSEKATTMVAVAIPVVSLGLPILDTAISVVRRFLSRKPLFTGDNDHIHHKLLKRGFSHRDAVLVLYAVTAAFGFLSLALLHGDSMIALVLAVIGLGVWIGVQNLQYAEFAELNAFFQNALNRRRLIANNVRIRQAKESLDACVDLDQLCRALKDALEPLGFDGFALRSYHLDDLPQSALNPLKHVSDGGLEYAWTNPSGSRHGWEFRFELQTVSGEKWGQFSVVRDCIEEPILLDINLLNDGFRRALSDAVPRAFARTLTSMEELRASQTQLISKTVSAD
jgi:UDP-GlcNAc:undecaprenyl-phosphate/decaprenyl-phosphate GlcNAc-1-phosphate transferase